jgi:hypothetical protein
MNDDETNDDLSRPSSAHTIHSGRFSAHSNASVSIAVSQSSTTKKSEQALAEEWGIQDPKLLATLLKRNKKIAYVTSTF